MTMEERHLEELLEKLWTLREAGTSEESALDPREFPESWSMDTLKGKNPLNLCLCGRPSRRESEKLLS